MNYNLPVPTITVNSEHYGLACTICAELVAPVNMAGHAQMHYQQQMDYARQQQQQLFRHQQQQAGLMHGLQMHNYLTQRFMGHHRLALAAGQSIMQHGTQEQRLTTSVLQALAQGKQPPARKHSTATSAQRITANPSTIIHKNSMQMTVFEKARLLAQAKRKSAGSSNSSSPMMLSLADQSAQPQTPKVTICRFCAILTNSRFELTAEHLEKSHSKEYYELFTGRLKVYFDHQQFRQHLIDSLVHVTPNEAFNKSPLCQICIGEFEFNEVTSPIPLFLTLEKQTRHCQNFHPDEEHDQCFPPISEIQLQTFGVQKSNKNSISTATPTPCRSETSSSLPEFASSTPDSSGQGHLTKSVLESPSEVSETSKTTLDSLISSSSSIKQTVEFDHFDKNLETTATSKETIKSEQIDNNSGINQLSNTECPFNIKSVNLKRQNQSEITVDSTSGKRPKLSSPILEERKNDNRKQKSETNFFDLV